MLDVVFTEDKSATQDVACGRGKRCKGDGLIRLGELVERLNVQPRGEILQVCTQCYHHYKRVAEEQAGVSRQVQGEEVIR